MSEILQTYTKKLFVVHLATLPHLIHHLAASTSTFRWLKYHFLKDASWRPYLAYSVFSLQTTPFFSFMSFTSICHYILIFVFIWFKAVLPVKEGTVSLLFAVIIPSALSLSNNKCWIDLQCINNTVPSYFTKFCILDGYLGKMHFCHI